METKDRVYYLLFSELSLKHRARMTFFSGIEIASMHSDVPEDKAIA